MKSFLITLATIISLQLSAQNIPSVSLKNLKGETVNIQDYANNGKITVISFWATWCVNCIKELDIIAKVYEEWQDEYDMELLAITIDDARKLPKVKPIVESKKWEYEILSDVKQDLMKGLNFQSVPMTFLLDKDGKLVYTHSGYEEGDENKLKDKIKALAGK